MPRFSLHNYRFYRFLVKHDFPCFSRFSLFLRFLMPVFYGANRTFRTFRHFCTFTPLFFTFHPNHSQISLQNLLKSDRFLPAIVCRFGSHIDNFCSEMIDFSSKMTDFDSILTPKMTAFDHFWTILLTFRHFCHLPINPADKPLGKCYFCLK